MKDRARATGRSATIKDVAADAGVSVATVSAVINNNKYVSPDLAHRVHESINALSYELNGLAQGLKKRTSYAIGLIISDITNPFFTSVVRGVEDVANSRNYSLILGNTDEDQNKEMSYMRLLESKRIDGMIVAHNMADNYGYIDYWSTRQFPLVNIDCLPPDASVDAVLIDNILGAAQAVEHLVALGHTRIGIVTGLSGLTTTEERLLGYQQALTNHGIPLDPTLMVEGNSRIHEGELAVLHLLTERTLRPSALFVTNGLMVIGALQAIDKVGLRCPEEIALVGFDDFELAAVMHPRLTTVRQPTYEIGKKAAQILFDRIEQRDMLPQLIRLQPQLIIRESCGAALGTPSTATSQILPGNGAR